MAIEEAILVENGFTDSAFDAGQESYPVTNHSGIQEVTGSNHDVGYSSPKKASFDMVDFYLLLFFHICLEKHIGDNSKFCAALV